MTNHEYYCKLPAWDLTQSQIDYLWKYYSDRQTNLQQYKTLSGSLQTLWLLFVPYKTPEIKNIVDSFPFVHDCYFIANKGIDCHIDDGRTATMSWCIHGANIQPTIFWDKQDENEVDRVDYNPGEAVLLNTKKWHSSPYQDKLRVFFQVELSQNLSYDQHRDILI